MSAVGSTGRPGFVADVGLDDDARATAVAALEEQLDACDLVRVGFADPHGILRSKVLTVATFRSALANGLDMSPGPLLFDSGHALPNDIFSEGGGIGVAELRGAGDFVCVPDPTTFRTVDVGGVRIGLVLADEYLRDGRPHPLSARHVLRHVVEAAQQRGLHPVIGLEVEWYLLRLSDPADRGTPGGFGVQGTTPALELVNRGYQFNSDLLMSDLLPLLAPVLATLRDDLGLPLRSVEHESGPGQIETTFDPLPALEAADAAVLLRATLKSELLRRGHVAAFMSTPGLGGTDPSGWHLHQSLADEHGRNLFAADDAPLSALGSSYVAGLLDSAAATTLLAVPTVNGYRRFQDHNTLSPDLVGWSHENRGALARVLGGPRDQSSHVENRVGEPTANPYLYIASQVAAGLRGIDRELTLPDAAGHPHEGRSERLPDDLGAAVDAAAESAFVLDLLGEPLHRNLLALKTSEWTRFRHWLGEQDGVLDPTVVTAWENDEYLQDF